ncbi:MAG: arginine repressor [Actinomycetia bacterium]|nr:arginine repressor [Actinomycetes bacterium]
MNRRERLKVIKEIINSKKVSSQEELVKELEVRGFSVTQSTISRDLDELRLTKVRNHRQQEYYSLDSRFYRENMFNYEKFSSKFAESVLSISKAQNILVIRTYPGEAQGTAAILDGMNFVEILGTVAGDDTIICIADNEENASRMQKFMKQY